MRTDASRRFASPTDISLYERALRCFAFRVRRGLNLHMKDAGRTKRENKARWNESEGR